MALVASTDFPIGQTLFAYNNNVIVFSSDDETKTPTFCDITINGTAFNTTIYPNPNNEFYYNFKEVFPSVVNSNSFQDLTDVRFDPSDVATYVYSEDESTYRELNISFSVTYQDSSVENLNRQVNILRASLDLETFKRYQIPNQLIDNTVLTTYAENGFVGFPRVGYAKYFEGYPFDFTFLSPSSVTINNLTNLDSITLENLTNVTRLGISDGRTDTTIDLFFLITDGVNILQFGDDSPSYKLKLVKENQCNEGVYLKWLNTLGGWSYWLFNKNYRKDLQVSNLGSINNDFNNLDQTTSPMLSLGKESNNTVRCLTDNIGKEDSDLLTTLFESPKVYLFTGTPFSKNTYQDWIEVEVSNRNVITKQYKNNLNSFEVVLKLPQKNTMKL